MSARFVKEINAFVSNCLVSALPSCVVASCLYFQQRLRAAARTLAIRCRCSGQLEISVSYSYVPCTILAPPLTWSAIFLGTNSPSKTSWKCFCGFGNSSFAAALLLACDVLGRWELQKRSKDCRRSFHRAGQENLQGLSTRYCCC